MKEMQLPKTNNRRLFALLATVVFLGTAVDSWSEEGRFSAPAKPQPVAPPPGIAKAANPMVSLSATQDYSAARVSSYEPKGGPRDNVWVPTDGSEKTLADIDGPGAITHIWTTHRGTGRDLVLRAYWDGSDHPSIEAPWGDFFGVAMSVNAPMNSMPIQVSSEGRSRNCWWYMPFNKSARITASATRSEENSIGEVQLSVNGQATGERVDTFKKTDDVTRPIWPPRRFDFPDVRLKQGENVFEFAVESKNPESTGYKMAIDCLVLKRQGE